MNMQEEFKNWLSIKLNDGYTISHLIACMRPLTAAEAGFRYAFMLQQNKIESLKEENERLKALESVCKEFIQKKKIRRAEQIYQTDAVIEDGYEFIEEICNTAGYYHDPSDEEEEDNGITAECFTGCCHHTKKEGK